MLLLDLSQLAPLHLYSLLSIWDALFEDGLGVVNIGLQSRSKPIKHFLSKQYKPFEYW